jgi:alpha-tubulin suppressor-like RCC1 family protein
MRRMNNSTRFACGLGAVWLTLSAYVLVATLTVTPADPAISVGQSVQFAANGTLVAAAVGAGGEYTCLRLPNGSVLCTGRNQFGQLGDGTMQNSSVLVPVSGLSTVTALAAGDEFACAVLADGTARCWGLGESGQRGDGQFSTFALEPVQVAGLTNAVTISAGYGHACALIADGTMRCWGSNAHGQLGNPSTGPGGSAVPVAVTGLTGIVAITAGAYHTCALRSDTTLSCWGDNTQGQLGNGTRTSASSPVAVNNINNVRAVSGGGVHTCAALNDGSAYCWGENEFGQLGNGTFRDSQNPVPVTDITTAVGVSAGWRHACVVLAEGAVRCWGQNAFGQLGDGTVTGAGTPTQVAGLTRAIAVNAGWWHHSCALLDDGAVQCWGTNEWGQFGNGTTTSSTTPITMTGTGVSWTSSDPSVATIDASGRATGIAAGLTTITATDATGSTGDTTLTVIEPPPPPVMLTVTKTGLLAGSGTVSSNPAGITCGSDCSESFAVSTVVTLTASPSVLFESWSGCDAVSGATCTVTMSAARSVSANFMKAPF